METNTKVEENILKATIFSLVEIITVISLLNYFNILEIKMNVASWVLGLYIYVVSRFIIKKEIGKIKLWLKS